MKKITIMFLTALSLCSCIDKSTLNGKLNDEASLPSALNFQHLGLSVITSFISKKQGTMSTLYGNNLAVKHSISGIANHTPGETFALVTWKQKDDPDWLGAKIPGRLQTIEMIKISHPSEGGDSVLYQIYDSKGIIPDIGQSQQEKRIKFIFGQKPSVMP